MTDWKVAFGTYIVEDDKLFATTFTEEKAKQIVHEHNAYEGDNGDVYLVTNCRPADRQKHTEARN